VRERKIERESGYEDMRRRIHVILGGGYIEREK
jgi:hypothetical protein